MQFEEVATRDIKKVRFQKSGDVKSSTIGQRRPRKKTKTCEMGTDTADQGTGKGLPLPRRKDERSKRYDEHKGRWKVETLLEAAAKLKAKNGGEMNRNTALFLIQKSGVTLEDLLHCCLAMDCPVPLSVGECYEPLEGGLRMADETLIEEAIPVIETLDTIRYQDCHVDLLTELLKWNTITCDNYDDDTDTITQLIAVFSFVFTTFFLFCVVWVLMHSEKKTFPEAYDAILDSCLKQSQQFLSILGNLTGLSLIDEGDNQIIKEGTWVGQ